MKKCAYCGTKVPRKKRKFYRMAMSCMGDSEPVCDKCVLEKQPELIVGLIGVMDCELS